MAAGSPGGAFYRQKRVGRHGRDFTLYKFRTMRPSSDKSGLLTIGGNDPRITRFGSFLRKYKLDELPQLFNVLGGSMSLVGPRPEVRKYVDLYTERQKEVLSVKPGLTDLASLTYFNESEILGRSPEPEVTYITEIMPAKLELSREYVRRRSFLNDLGIMFKTVARIFRRSQIG